MATPIAPRASTRDTISSLTQFIRETAFSDDVLPPEREISERLNATRHAVRIALERLAEEGLVRADGRSWKVLRENHLQSLYHGALVVLTDVQTRTETSSPESLERIAAGALDAARAWAIQQGRVVLCIPVQAIDASIAAKICSESPCGVVLAAPLSAPERVAMAITPLLAAGIPLATHGLAEDLPLVDTASSDHLAGCAALIGWLAQQGCRRILRGWGDPAARGAWLKARDSGCRKGCRTHHLTALPLIPRLPEALAEGALSRDEFERQVDALAGVLAPQLTAPEPPDAILAMSDRHAFQLSAAIHRFNWKGRPPLVCGYDAFWSEDWQLPWSCPPAVSVDKRNFETGQAVFALLAERLAGFAGPPRHRLIAPRLVPT